MGQPWPTSVTLGKEDHGKSSIKNKYVLLVSLLIMEYLIYDGF